MTISVNQLAKRYQQHWVFKEFTYSFEPEKKVAVLGANGSGKSTLLRVLGGIQNPSKGDVIFTIEGKNIDADKRFKYLSYVAPGMDIVEELTLSEYFHFHFKFKKLLSGFTIAQVIEACDLQHATNQQIFEFSSGMKQRVKLAQAFFANTPLLLIDEPCSNLDAKGVALYQRWLADYTKGRLIIIASNDEREYPGVNDVIAIEDYK